MHEQNKTTQDENTSKVKWVMKGNYPFHVSKLANIIATLQFKQGKTKQNSIRTKAHLEPLTRNLKTSANLMQQNVISSSSGEN